MGNAMFALLYHSSHNIAEHNDHYITQGSQRSHDDIILRFSRDKLVRGDNFKRARYKLSLKKCTRHI